MGKTFRLSVKVFWLIGIVYVIFLVFKSLGWRSFEDEAFTYIGLFVFFVAFWLDALFVTAE